MREGGQQHRGNAGSDKEEERRGREEKSKMKVITNYAD